MQDDGGFSEAVASIRIVYIDHYLLPLSEYSSSLSFHAARLRLESTAHCAKLPVVRIFGSTPAGQKACLHLHGALPYMYLPVPQGLSASAAVSLAERLRAALEAALRAMVEVEAGSSNQNQRNRPPPAIASLSPVLKTSIYGYKKHPALFLHLKAYNPRTILRISEILAQGGLPGDLPALRLQPFESHIPFHLQVLTDLSLVGMGYINLRSCRFRLPLPPGGDTKEVARAFARPNVTRMFQDGMQYAREDLVWPFVMPRRAKSELELDAFVDDVLNPRQSPANVRGGEPPSCFVSKTLRILWEEERLRTGCTPVARKEEPRKVSAGPDCTDGYLRTKLQALVTGKAPASGPVGSFTPDNKAPLSQNSGRSNTQDGNESMQSKEILSSMPSSFDDVFRYLDRDPIADESENEFHGNGHFEAPPPNHDVILDSDGEVVEEQDAASQWADIAQCTQSTDDIKPIPQGDAPGDESEEDNKRPRNDKKSSKLRRKSKRARRYAPLMIEEAPALERSSAARVFTQSKEDKISSDIGGTASGDIKFGGVTQIPTSNRIRIASPKHESSIFQNVAGTGFHAENEVPRPGDLVERTALRSQHPEAEPLPQFSSTVQNESNGDDLLDSAKHTGREQTSSPRKKDGLALSQPWVTSPRKIEVSQHRRSSQVLETKNIRIKSQMQDRKEERPVSRLNSASVRVLPKRNDSPGKQVTKIPSADEFLQQIAVGTQQPDSGHASGTQSFSRARCGPNVDQVSDFEEEAEAEIQPDFQKTIVTFSSQPWKSAPRKIEISPRGSQPLIPEVDKMQVDNVPFKNSIEMETPKKKASLVIKFSSESSLPKTPSQAVDSAKGPQTSPQSSMSTPLPLTQPERTPGSSDTKSAARSTRPRRRHRPLDDDPQSPSSYIRPVQNPPSLAELRKTQLEHSISSVIHTPAFYGNPKDAPQKPEVFAGVTFKIPVGGLENKPAFISEFRGEDHGVIASASHLIPVQRPPTNSELRGFRLADVTKGDRTRTQRVIIDSAGRQIRVEDKSGLGFESMSQDSSAAIPPVANAEKIKRRGDGDGMDSDSDESALGDGSFVLSLPRDSPAAKMRQAKSIVERPASPKYDERCFYQDIASSQGSSERRHSSRMESATKTPTTSLHANQNLTYLSVEILSSCIGKNEPDPSRNPILAICAIVVDSREHIEHRSALTLFQTGGKSHRLSPSCSVQSYASETSLLDGFVGLVSRCDPDVITGFEIQSASIGYILERAAAISHSLPQTITRDLERDKGRPHAVTGHPAQDSAAAAYFRRKGANVTVRGRHLLNLWRIVRSEVKLACYSAEGVALELLHTRLPRHTTADLETMLKSPKTAPRALSYLCRRTQLVVDIIEKLDVVGRTGELARVFGVDFMSVLTRGSQFRVESMLARVAHERGFVLLAAQKEQVFAQPAVESLPLVMEPMSALYVDPVIVLDFQSLYPSMIIAHNLCFSTMMGNINRIQSWGEPRHVGVVKGYKPPDVTSFGPQALNRFFVAPNGELFVTADERLGILPQMLNEILTTRIMVKSALKAAGNDDPSIARLLNARQFGLKMIANVTYGYASASFSGRMPCANLADAIVQCGRDALEKMVDFVDNELSEDTGASVVYGDTDSLFVKVPGATRAEAFDIGDRIVAKSLELFPSPVRLQLEKVYHPCVLQAKKRYVGYCYETRDQAVPTFDAKGIETVRRDSCELVQSTLERAIRVLFETRDISHVKRTVQRTWQRVLSNRLPLSAYIFRKEVKLGSYKEGHLPPAAIVAARAMERDPRAAPRYGERVPFVVIYAGAAATLRDSVVAPEALLAAERDGLARLNATYYITKQTIPALDRVFSLVGVRVASWFAELPRTAFPPLGAHPRAGAMARGASAAARNSLYRYYASAKCALCRGKTTRTRVCDACAGSDGAKRDAYFVLTMRVRRLEQMIFDMRTACAVCVGVTATDPATIDCGNLSCDIKLLLNASSLRLQGCQDALKDESLW